MTLGQTDERSETGDLEGDLELLSVLEEWHSVRVVLKKHILLLRLTAEEDGEEERLSGVIDLLSKSCKIQGLPQQTNLQAAKAFTIWVGGRSITLKAETAEEAAGWVQALQSVMMPSGSCIDEEEERPAETREEPGEEVVPQMTEERPEQEPAKAPVPAPAPESRSNQGPLHKTPNRTPKTGSDKGGVQFVGAYSGGARSASGGRGWSDRRAARREKENIPAQSAVPSMREAMAAESMEEATVQVVKKGASAIAEEREGLSEASAGESKVEDTGVGEGANSSRGPCRASSLRSEPSVQQIIEKSSSVASQAGSARSPSNRSVKSDHWQESLKLFEEVEEIRLQHATSGAPAGCASKACCTLQ